ncbi:hypothetical protein GCM10009592_19250 [Brachybacterium rhamnosum]|uniref:Uncharacterized protein n=1 Tax=Brachybacterium rhamnosum TaxID=173361 RepID=A0ABW4Q0G2_9MICO
MTRMIDTAEHTDAEGRLRVVHGVDIEAGGADGTAPVTAQDLRQLAELGLDAVRIVGAGSAEQARELLDLAGAEGLSVILADAPEAGAGHPALLDVSGLALRELSGEEPLDEELLDALDQGVTGWIYHRWEPGFATSEVARTLRRPRPVAVAGTSLRSGRSAGGSWKAAWDGAEASAPSEFWVPEELDVEVVVDGARTSLTREGARVLVPAGPGEHRLRVS